jgi:hypothetical protein
MAMITFAIEHIPDTGSGCPMFDLTDPIRSGVFLPLQNTWSIVFSSSGSPTCSQLQHFIRNWFIKWRVVKFHSWKFKHTDFSSRTHWPRFFKFTQSLELLLMILYPTIQQ